jgi:putative DNA primase/helicase
MVSNYRRNVAQEMIDQIEAGAAPWQKPWKAGVVRTRAFNPATGKDYRGINSWWLEMQGFSDPRWLTYRQAQQLDAQVRKGERGTTVEYWQWTRTAPVLDEDGNPVLDDEGNKKMATYRLERPRVFYARVFNAEQIDGLAPYVAPAPSFAPHERAEKVLADAGIPIRHDQSDRAFYRPATDSIHLPAQAAFPEAYEYYATALHEIGHATGHPSRLNREFGPFGSEAYAKEELRAEMASFMMTTEVGLGHYPERHAGYVQSWLKVLKDDHNLLFQAARDAELARTWVLEPEKRQTLERQAVKQQENVQAPAPAAAPSRKPEQTLALASAPGTTVRLQDRMVVARGRSSETALGGTPAIVNWAMEEGLSPADLTAVLTLQGNAAKADPGDILAMGAGFLGRDAQLAGNQPGSHAGAMMHIGARFALQDTEAGPVVHDLAALDYDARSVAALVTAQQAQAAVTLAYDRGGKLSVEADMTPLKEWLVRQRVPLSSRPDATLALDEHGGLFLRTVGGEVPLAEGRGAQGVIANAVKHNLTADELGAAVRLYADGNAGYPEEALEFFTDYLAGQDARHDGSKVELARDGAFAGDIVAVGSRYALQSLAAPGETGRFVVHDVAALDYDGRSLAALGAAMQDGQAATVTYAEGRGRATADTPSLRQWQGLGQHRVSEEKSATQTDEAKKERVYLAVPYAEKNQAKARGARWDRHRKSWYAPPGVDLASSGLKDWLPNKEAAPARDPATDPVAEFAAALKEHGLVLDGPPVMDGRWHRVPVDDDAKGKKSGSYRGFIDGVPNGQIMNYKHGPEATKWIATGSKVDPAEMAEMKAAAAARAAEREAERAAAAERAAQVARGMLVQASVLDGPGEHPYLSRKEAHPFGGVRMKDDMLLVPMQNSSGAIMNVQSISPDGQKRFVKGGEKKGLMHVIDSDREINRAGVILVAEGYATASSLHEATGVPVVVAFDAGNMKPVGEALQQKHPNASLVFAADNDHASALNAGLEGATRAAEAVNGKVIAPAFTDAEKARGLTDYNDLMRARGAFAGRQAVREDLGAALEAPKAKELKKGKTKGSTPEMAL